MAGNKKPAKKYNPNVRIIRQGKRPSVKSLSEKLRDVEAFKICEPPHHSLNVLSTNKYTEYDWQTVTWRIRVGFVLADIAYAGEVTERMKTGYELCCKMFERRAEEVLLTSDEFEDLKACINAVDDMTMEITRETQIFAFKKSRAYMHKHHPVTPSKTTPCKSIPAPVVSTSSSTATATI